MPDKVLFSNYEFDNSKWNKVILRLLGASFVVHLIVVLIVLFVPVVRDAFYVASLFGGVPTSWGKGEYDKTEIGEESVTMLNLPPSNQLEYPAGYFELANGDAAPPSFTDSTTLPTPDLISQVNGFPNDGVSTFPPIGAPTPFPTPAPYKFPSSVYKSPRAKSILPPLPEKPKGAKIPPFEANSPNPTTTAQATPKPSPTTKVSPTPNPSAVAQTSPSPQAPVEDGKLNQQPLLDLAGKAIKQLNDKQLDLNKPINVTINGVLDDKGKLVAKETKYKNNGGDENSAKLAADLIAAMSDSNMLTYIKALSDGSTKRSVIFNITKDDKDFKFQLIADVGDADRVKKIYNSLNIGISYEKFRKEGTEEGELLKLVNVGTANNQVVIDWQMDTPTALRKINNKLADVQKKQQAQPASQTQNNNAQATVK